MAGFPFEDKQLIPQFWRVAEESARIQTGFASSTHAFISFNLAVSIYR